jgi:NodT family efflux transporter outer membrane factor (OMF) lipoprotein
MWGERHYFAFLFSVFALFACQGCMVGPDYVRPDVELSDTWHQEATRGLAEGRADIQSWWGNFGDSALDELIEEASLGNFDVKQAHARVMQARASLAIASGERWPDIDAIGSWTRLRESESISPVTGPGLDRTDTFYSIGGRAFWEIDLWGRISRNIESAEGDFEASIEDLRDVMVILYAEVASNYIQVRTFQAKIRYAEENIKRQEGTLELTSARFKAGLVGKLDIRQAELNLARTRSVIPQFREGLKQAINRLEVLIGQSQGSLYDKLEKERDIPEIPDQITVGVPADLLRQRPDVRRAERLLASQTAQIGVATAALYPQFDLTGDFFFDSARGSISGIFRESNRAWSLGPSFAWNIFDGGRVRSNIKLQEYVTDEAYFNYNQAILLAIEDVENSMVAYVQQSDRYDELTDSVTAASQSVELVTTLYRTGLVDFQNVLDMERSLFEQQDELVSSEGTKVTNLINIYRALGGGWSPKLHASAAEEIKGK